MWKHLQSTEQTLHYAANRWSGLLSLPPNLHVIDRTFDLRHLDRTPQHLYGHAGTVGALAFSADGRTLVRRDTTGRSGSGR